VLTETLNTSTEEALRRELAEVKAKLERIAEKNRERNRRNYLKDPKKAIERSRRYLYEVMEDGQLRHQHYYKSKRVGSFEKKLKVMFVSARQRSKKLGIEFGIVEGDVVRRETCPVSGVALNFSSTKISDNSPALDRIDPSKGYVPGNVWVICQRVNRIKNNATAKELMMIANAVNRAEDRLRMGLPACDAE
jgi:hypothetical protein